MKITFISDTHGKHRELKIPQTDLLIHAGDFSKTGTIPQIQDFMQWLSTLDIEHKVIIAGNHDFLAEREPNLFRPLIPRDCIYLEDSGVTIEGIHIWGSPITPWFFDWAFNRQRGEEIRQYWDKIPDNTDILITHGPPQSILDRTARGALAGCQDLLETVKKVQPKIHVFGHIHEAAGQEIQDDILFINASMLNLSYDLIHQPIELNWEDFS